MNARSVVCTFDRHPLSVLRPDRAPKPLLTLQQNLLKFERLGADYALVKPFTREFADTEPEDYLRQLVERMRVKAIVVGENYTFGAKGRGDADLIRKMAPELGYRALVVAPVMDGSVMASSTYVRALQAVGETAHVHRLMDIPVARG
jgi:riboflavin kinase/FMN adenylyltransferase